MKDVESKLYSRFYDMLQTPEYHYYNKFYDILQTPEYDEKFRILNPQHRMHYLGNSKNKKCRFCGRSEDKVSFKKIAHVFPEAIGNSVLASYYECDECNQYFGNSIENEYSNFFNLHHSMMGIKGKKGKTVCKFKIPCKKKSENCKRYCVEVSDGGVARCEEVSEEYVQVMNNNLVRISKSISKCNMIAVFKELVKMAISVMPVEELELFSKTREWLLDPKHLNIYSPQKLLVRYRMIYEPNYRVDPHYVIYRRKNTIWNKPYLIFNLTYGYFSLMIEVPRDNNFKTDSGFEKIPFPPIIFKTLEEGSWDMSHAEVPRNMKSSIILAYENAVNATDEYEIIKKNNRPEIVRKNEQKSY